MSTFLLASAAGYGTFLLYTACTFGWRGLRPSPGIGVTAPRRARIRRALGLVEVDLRGLGATCIAFAVAACALAAFVVGPGVASIVVAMGAGVVPIAAQRRRDARRRAEAAEAWPRLIDEVRVLTSASGRSVPHALFQVGARAPEHLRRAFAEAHREWLLTTDLDHSLTVLRIRLDDPTADVVCETLVVAHQLGGADLDRRLRTLAEDRRTDLDGRKDAVARQSGARFARRFVVLVPAGMAVAGMGIGDGRAAYATPTGQAAVVVATAIVGACWWWAGRIMALPRPTRVLRP